MAAFIFFVFFGFDRCCDVLWWLSFFLFFFSVLIGVVMFCGGFHFFLFFSVLIGVVMFCGGFHFFFLVLIGVVMFCGGFQVFFGFDRCCDVLWWFSKLFFSVLSAFCGFEPKKIGNG